MKVIKSINHMRQWSYEQRIKKNTIGFVPTMGFLHKGHLSLMRKAKEKCDKLIVSIFVNPTQFGLNEDLERYPRDFEQDHALCEQEQVDVIFFPQAEEIYPKGYLTYVYTEEINKILEGETRPIHFRGVTTIVSKLFNIVLPNLAVFGQKDAQQVFILQQMVKDLNFDIEMIIAPIIREEDGLAMSSRNKYLSTEERAQSSILYHSLKLAKERLFKGESDYQSIKKDIQALINSCDRAKIDYIAFVDADTFQPPESTTKRVQILIAVYFGSTRLIDNLIVKIDD